MKKEKGTYHVRCEKCGLFWTKEEWEKCRDDTKECPRCGRTLFVRY
jgi:NAD-dependent SIR2 family protein deacetylase